MKTKVKRIPITFLTTFLLMFMLLIFGPSEIFFANVTEFRFVYGEFAGYMAVFALLGALLLTAILFLLTDKLYTILLNIVFGVSVAGYLQVMFLNKNLDLLGLNPEGYAPDKGAAIGNLLIWLAIIGAVVGISFWKNSWKKVVLYGSAFLLCVQTVALVSLLVTAKPEAYKHPEVEGTWHLSGENQYSVSADKNVIVIILDFFGNHYLDSMKTVYPDATDFLHDFTYYSNTDCTYFGTYPSLPRMLTGNELDMSANVNQWLEQSWNGEIAESFYSQLAENNYVANVYTPDIDILCGTNDVQMLDGKITNVVNSAQEIDVFYKLLFKTMGKMSAYRMTPDILKPYFYDSKAEYTDIVTVKENKVDHHNFEFYQGLKEKGLTADDSSNYYIVQHLRGEHAYTTDEFGAYKKDSTAEETAKGCMVIVEEYLNQLKELGVYDDSTIIITADHGDEYASQVIFFMKQAGETHEESPVTNAPISLQEYLPTIAEAVGLDYSQYGLSVHDFAEDELRERTVWVREYDDSYPSVPCYTGDKQGECNVFYGYTYTGEKEDLFEQWQNGPSEIVEMVESFH